MNKTKIDWCDYTWNPAWGCLNDCPYCYARKMARRWGKSFEPHWMERNFNKPMPKEPSRIFVNSMSEIAYWDVTWLRRVFRRIEEYPQHHFLFLTKCLRIYFYCRFPVNCWLGATVVCQGDIEHLCSGIPGSNLFYASIEPMMERIDPESLYNRGLAWVIIGAETGNRKNRIIPSPDWIKPFLSLEIPVFMKDNLRPYWPGPWRKEFPA